MKKVNMKYEEGINLSKKGNYEKSLDYLNRSKSNFMGLNKIIQSDNESEHKNNLIKEYHADNGIIQIFSLPKHPQINGMIEIAHKETSKFILIII